MRTGLLATAALLCAIPASGQDARLPQQAIDALTPFDSVPSTTVLNSVFAMPLVDLRAIALDPLQDLGIALRAVRALPGYCPPAPQVCDDTTDAHQTMIALIDAFWTAFRTDASGQNLMRLRAAVEALGAMRSGLASDVEKLAPLLDDPSRDLRVTVTRALRNICNSQAIAPLNQRFTIETTTQVKYVMYDALSDLRQCN